MTAAATSPERSVPAASDHGPRATAAGTGRFGFCITMPPRPKSSVAPRELVDAVGVDRRSTGRRGAGRRRRRRPRDGSELHVVRERAVLLARRPRPRGRGCRDRPRRRVPRGPSRGPRSVIVSNGVRCRVHVAMIGPCHGSSSCCPPPPTGRADFVAAARALGVEVVVASEAMQALAGDMGDRAVVVPLETGPPAPTPSSPCTRVADRRRGGGRRPRGRDRRARRATARPDAHRPRGSRRDPRQVPDARATPNSTESLSRFSPPAAGAT